MTPTELLAAYLTGLRDFRDADLTLANLTGADLTGANLTGASLTGADLTRADFAWASLTRASLTRANLTGADLTGADLTGADLTGATRADRKLLSHGSIGRAPSSGRTVTWLVYEGGEPEIIAGCFNGTPAELRSAARKTHADNPAALDWYLRVASWIARDSRDAQGRAQTRAAI